MVSGVDYPHLTNRFEVSYELLSLKYNTRLRIKCFVNEIDHIFSVSSIFLSATWWEREVWDMFGVYFVNNPDLRRILTDYGFVGHPLRKDFPLIGFVETFYDSKTKMVSYGFTETSQKQRVFLSYSPDLND
jgi:NADH:ubiquinone oxidoreductase subunit C